MIGGRRLLAKNPKVQKHSAGGERRGSSLVGLEWLSLFASQQLVVGAKRRIRPRGIVFLGGSTVSGFVSALTIMARRGEHVDVYPIA